jgi:hypothetical protein
VEAYAFATDFCKLSVLWFRRRKLYSDGLCLPSGSNLNEGDDQRIAESLNLFLKCKYRKKNLAFEYQGYLIQ